MVEEFIQPRFKLWAKLNTTALHNLILKAPEELYFGNICALCIDSTSGATLNHIYTRQIHYTVIPTGMSLS